MQLYYTAKFFIGMMAKKIPLLQGILNKSLFFITLTVSTDS